MNPQLYITFSRYKVDRPGEDWRSRFIYLGDEQSGIEYNTGHRDYKRAEKGGKKSITRYLERIYAKHIVLHNFGGQNEEVITERMLELLTIMESVNKQKK